jgi:sugar O-acyltransferase (sialic acid O-acetyltransferase NeuD family)
VVALLVSTTGPVPLVLVGGGGHASDVLQAVEAINALTPAWQVVGILDDRDVDARRFVGRNVEQIGKVDDIDSVDACFVLCIGWPWEREAVAMRIADRAEPAPSIIHPGADIGTEVRLGQGSVVLGNAHVSPMVQLGPHSFVSYGATVGHDCAFGAFASVMPGANVSGDVTAGDAVLVGSGAVVLEGVHLGDRVRVGAGAVVTGDVDVEVTVVGMPAVPIGGHDHAERQFSDSR